jgi:hypothetical protein
MRHNSTTKVRVPLDNYEPVARRFFDGDLEEWVSLDESSPMRTLVLKAFLQARANGGRAVYLIDDGSSVKAYYVAGYAPLISPMGDPETRGDVFLRPMPTNYTDDQGREIYFDNWLLGPRYAYHVKVQVSTRTFV